MRGCQRHAHAYTHKEQAAGEGGDEPKAGTRVTWLAMTHREMVTDLRMVQFGVSSSSGEYHEVSRILGHAQLNKGNTYRYWNQGCLVIER